MGVIANGWLRLFEHNGVEHSIHEVIRPSLLDHNGMEPLQPDHSHNKKDQAHGFIDFEMGHRSTPCATNAIKCLLEKQFKKSETAPETRQHREADEIGVSEVKQSGKRCRGD